MDIKINPALMDGDDAKNIIGLNLPCIDYRDVKELQGTLKDLSRANYQRLRNSLKKDGLIAPFYIWWQDDVTPYLVDGHQRRRVFITEKVEPFKIPYIAIPADSFEDAKKKLLQVTSQYGTITHEGFDEFKVGIDNEWIKENTYFDNLFREFNPKFATEEDEQKEDEKQPKASDDGYSNYELVMKHENKTRLLSVLNEIKVENAFEKQEEALMYLCNLYSENKTLQP